MLKTDRIQATKEKGVFEFSYTQPSLDWYETINVKLSYNDYNYLSLERRFGPCWWLTGQKYNKHLERWEKVDIGRIENHDIKRLIEWCRYKTKDNRTISILEEVRGINGDLNAIDEFIELIKEIYETKSNG